MGAGKRERGVREVDGERARERGRGCGGREGAGRASEGARGEEREGGDTANSVEVERWREGEREGEAGLTETG